MKSWFTTIFGLIGIAGTTFATFFPQYANVGHFLAAFAASAGLLFARDNHVTDEQAGAGKKNGVYPRVKLLAIVGVGALLAFSGCAFFGPVAPGADPVVVNAERTAKLSFTLADSFVQWEFENRATLPKEATEAADVVRKEFPTAYRAFRAATKAYKVNRTDAAKLNLQTAQAEIGVLLKYAQKYLPEATVKAGTAKADALLTVPEIATP